jgi:hypothetical protein
MTLPFLSCTAAEEETVGFFSSHRENRSPQAFPEARNNLFLPGDNVRAQEGNAAGGLTNVGSNGKCPVAFSHVVGGESKIGGQSQGFLGGQLRKHREEILLSGWQEFIKDSEFWVSGRYTADLEMTRLLTAV